MLSIATRRKHARLIRSLLLDVDGVLTQGTVLLNDYGVETLLFCVADGYGIRLLQEAGIPVAWISSRTSQAVVHRANALHVNIVHQGVNEKMTVYEQFLQEHRLQDTEVAYVGDDLLDLPVLKRVGLSVAVANAVEPVRRSVDWVTTRRGGEGAVREVADFILESQKSLKKTKPKRRK